MTIQDIISHIITTYPGTVYIQNEHGVFFNAKEGQIFPFATIVDSDNEFDHLSNLTRSGYFRLNIGISQEAATKLFGDTNPTTDEWKTKDFTQANILMPHPMYASLGRISIINPDEASFESLKPHLERAYHAALTQDARIRK